MQNRFTQKTRKLRANLDATSHERRQFLEELRSDVRALRTNARSFLQQLHKSNNKASEQVQAGLMRNHQKRCEMGDDLREGERVLRSHCPPPSEE